MAIEVKVARDTSTMRPGDWFRIGRLALRHRTLILGFSLVCLAVATVAAVLRKNVYEASTEIIVRPQYIPQDFIKPTVSQDLSTVVKTLSQQIMSRGRLQKIIEEFDLYPEIRRERGVLEAIETMRTSIRVENWSADSFKISYRGHDPVVVRDVANTLASLFIQENLRSREQEAQSITEYLEKELTRAQQELEQAEAEIRSFQEQNMGALPSQEQAIAGTLGGLMAQYQTLSDQIRAAQSRKLILTGQQRDQARIVMSQPSGGAGGAGAEPLASATAELARARRQMDTLLRQYTEDHPQVISQRALVRELEPKAAAERAAATAAGRPLDLVGTPSESLAAEIRTTDREIADLSAERVSLQRRMAEQETSLSRIPRVAEQFSSLRRKYEFSLQAYNDLRNKAEEARRSQQMEERQKGEQFEIVDKAVVPSSPRHPRKEEIVLAGLLFGFGLGFGVAFLRAFLDPTFRARDDLASAIALPVLSSIPRIEEGRSA